MIDRKQFLVAAASALLAGSLVACGGNANSNADAGSGTNAASGSDAAAKTLVVAASPSPHAQILQDFAAPLLAKKGITLEVKEYTDYIQPNVATENGEVDANYFQHINYLNNYNKENGTDLESAGAIHYEPFGVYSNKHSDLASIEDGAVIAIPNDPTNEGRALLVLQQEGLIALKDPENLEATPKDIAENTHNLEFQELEAAALPRALDDVDYAVINGNYAIEAGMHVADAVAVEANDGKAVEQYGNIICTTPDKLKDERIVALVEALQSKDFADYLKKTYDQDVLPAV
ncbi:MAG: MetQ/NlpA family ABC transporter substrate-binding protein [Atopobiaceae bacterium]|nr:MetQ/NlpA family ABC transporter substrate-binding protein [Atopobiaceae bacterium]